MKKQLLYSLAALPLLFFTVSCTAIKYHLNPDAQVVMDYSEDKLAKDSVDSEVESVVIRYQYTGSDGDCTCVVHFRRPNKFRLSFLWDNEAEVYASNGRDAWMYVDKKFSKMDEETFAVLKDSAFIMPFFVEYDEIIDEPVLEEDTDYAGGEECYVVSGISRDAARIPIKLYFSQDSKLLNQIQIFSKEGIYETTFMEYMKFSDMKFAKYIYIEGPDVPAAKLELLEVEINQLNDNSCFEQPEKIESFQVIH